MKHTVLLTGGTGFIGSHIAVELLQNSDYEVVIVDNLANSQESVLDSIQTITGRRPVFYPGDIVDRAVLERVFVEHDISSVIHLAGLKAVGESVAHPLSYYRNNIDSTLTLLEVMQDHGVRKLLFSSSATVYGNPEVLPLTEDSPVGGSITNPYGRTKYMIEQILGDLAVSDPSWQIVSLRYFNPIGAHPSGLIGENPSDIPNNIMPIITQVASGKREKLMVYGRDYDTPDGTCQRDYIHVVDLARGHVAALNHITEGSGYQTYNLGTGRPVSVLELIRQFETSAGVAIPYEITDRRPGDVPVCYADPSRANAALGWRAEKSVADACMDVWRYLQAQR